MKKLISLLLAAVMALALAACGEESTSSTDSGAGSNTGKTSSVATSSEDVSSEDVSSEDVSSEDVSSEDVSSEDVSSETESVPSVQPVIQEVYRYKGLAVNDSTMQAYTVYLTFNTKGGTYSDENFEQKSTTKPFFTTWPTADGFKLIAKDTATAQEKTDLVDDALAWYGDVVPANVTFDQLYDTYFDQIGGITYNSKKYLSVSGGGMFVSGAFEYSVSGTTVTIGKTLVKAPSSDVAYTIESLKWSEDHKTMDVKVKFSNFTKELTLQLMN